MYQKIRTLIVTALVEYVKKNRNIEMLIEHDTDELSSMMLCEEFHTSDHKKYARCIKVDIKEIIEEVE